MSETFQYTAILAQQSTAHTVCACAVRPGDILKFAEIDRAGRTEEGELVGFQRHHIASHIRDIRDYLAREDAVLPNPIVLAFTDGVRVHPVTDNVVRLEIDATHKPGFVVDGQQRLTALSGLPDKDFEVFVSVLLCKDYNELRQQFVLINSARPLPKSLIYELLPRVDGLPEKFTSRQFAATVTEQLNFRTDSVFRGRIRLHTNPDGVMSDTAVQKIVLNSVSDGAMGLFMEAPDAVAQAVSLIHEFFSAVREIFLPDWDNCTPRTSRLVHGAGLVAMGYVMEYLHSRYDARSKDAFKEGLRPLIAKTAWSNGVWPFSDTDQREWNKIQNVPNDILCLAYYLLRIVKQ